MKIGTSAATTPQLLAALNTAEDLGYELLLDDNLVRRLDPTGIHIVCLNPELDTGAAPDSIGPTGIPLFTRETTLASPMRCEVMLKLKGRKPAYEVTLDIPVASFYDFERLDKYAPRVLMDGDSQRG